MAKATLTGPSGKEVVYEDIKNLSMSPPYWIIQAADDVREFIHFDGVLHVRVEGEEELIQNARQKLNQDLGVEA